MTVAGALRRRLIACLALTASAIDGEALAAARSAGRILEAAGLGWDQVITPADQSAQPPDSWHLDLAFCGRHLDAVTDWERTFLGGIARCAEPSDRQRSRLTRIVVALRAEGRV